MKTYKKITDPVSNKSVILATDENGQEFWIPVDTGNSDYQEYLKSLDEASPL
jgi:hypothetical protein